MTAEGSRNQPRNQSIVQAHSVQTLGVLGDLEGSGGDSVEILGGSFLESFGLPGGSMGSLWEVLGVPGGPWEGPRGVLSGH